MATVLRAAQGSVSMCRGHGQQLAVAAHLLDEVVDVGEDAALRSGVSKRSRTRDALRRLTIVERSEREQRLEGARACVCVCVCVCVCGLGVRGGVCGQTRSWSGERRRLGLRCEVRQQ
jgi:hypothetical protein